MGNNTQSLQLSSCLETKKATKWIKPIKPNNALGIGLGPSLALGTYATETHITSHSVAGPSSRPLTLLRAFYKSMN